MSLGLDSGQPASRRRFLKLATAAAAGLAAYGWERPTGEVLEAAQPAPLAQTERWPALAMKIATPGPGEVPETDLRRDFGAVGDGAQDDGPAFRALADAVNSGAVAPGSVVLVPPGRCRVVGNDTIVFRRPVVIRGAGTAETTIQIEYSAHRSTFLRAMGQGMYIRHSTGTYSFGQDANRYPNAPYSSVDGIPRRGDARLTLEEAGLLAPGDEVYLLCDDYGPEVIYSLTNKRSQHFILKQYGAISAVEGDDIWLDAPLRHDFAGAAPRLYRWQPLVGFGIEHLTIEDRSDIPNSEAANTFRAVQLDGLVDGWVWDVHFVNNTSIPLQVGRSRHVVVSECLFDGARHVGGGGNGYLPEIYFSDDCLVEYCTSIQGRHALACNWSCWGNVFRYNRVVGTPNTETHGEYSVENLYFRNDCRDARMEIGGGGAGVHAHDGPYNEITENYARVLQVLKANDRENRLVGNWHLDPTVDRGTETAQESNHQVPRGWDEYPFMEFCGHDHRLTAESARPT